MSAALRTFSLFVFAGLPVAALADDVPVAGSFSSVAGQPDVDWTGPSVGLGFGIVPDANGGDGTLLGARIAYDYDFGDFIVGGILEYSGADFDFAGGGDVDSVLRIGARGGFDSGLNWYYVSAGYAEIETSGENSPGDGDGYFLGLGYERFVGEKLTLGAELVYTDFDNFDDEIEVHSTAVGLSVNFRF